MWFAGPKLLAVANLVCPLILPFVVNASLLVEKGENQVIIFPRETFN